MNVDKKDKLIIGLIIGIVMIISSNFIREKVYNDDSLEIIKSSESTSIEESNTGENNIKKVHISGEILKPGVYQINEGDRLDDLVKKAGGLTQKADIDRINLALILEDQMRIIIPNIDDENKDTNTEFINKSSGSEKININTADKSELMNLPNIGEKRADAIIEYRENKKFEKIEDIKNVSGIGDKFFESLKDSIRAWSTI